MQVDGFWPEIVQTKGQEPGKCVEVFVPTSESMRLEHAMAIDLVPFTMYPGYRCSNRCEAEMPLVHAAGRTLGLLIQQVSIYIVVRPNIVKGEGEKYGGRGPAGTGGGRGVTGRGDGW